MRSKRKTTLITSLIVLLLTLTGAGYWAADRYLIEHVEIADVNAVAATAVQTQASGSNVLAAQISAAAAQSTATSGDVETATESLVLDDWNYQTDSVRIAIQKVTTGSGSNTLTYFVADVQLTDATQLESAFAKNSFGRNIIAYTSAIAAENNAIFAINGDYYGFRTDGIVIRNGVIYRDAPTRTGLAFYKDGTMRIYDETQTSAQALLDAGVWNTLSFGPAILENGEVPANLTSVEVDTNFGNHSIQGNQPRTAIGIIDANHFIFIVVDGRSTGYSRGAGLPELAQIFKDLGCTNAYNIDGGGSSTMYFDGRVVNNPLGRSQERGTSDILFVGM